MLIKSYDDYIKIEGFLKLIERDCQPFLNLLRENKITDRSGYTNHLLYRGITKRGGKEFLKEKVRKDRKSQSSYRLIDQKLLDSYFKKEYGIEPSQKGVFCSFDTIQAERYGDLYTIFPIGDFDYLVSEWQDSIDIWISYLEDISNDGKIPGEYIEKIVKRDFHFNSNIKRAIKRGTEVVMICDKYYAIKDTPKYYQKIVNFIYK